MYMYGWVPSLSTWNFHNVVNWLCSNQKENVRKIIIDIIASPQKKTMWWVRLKVKVVQSCRTLCNPMDYTVHGILQARILEWVAVPFSRDPPNPSPPHCRRILNHLSHSETPDYSRRKDKTVKTKIFRLTNRKGLWGQKTKIRKWLTIQTNQ